MLDAIAFLAAPTISPTRPRDLCRPEKSYVHEDGADPPRDTARLGMERFASSLERRTLRPRRERLGPRFNAGGGAMRERACAPEGRRRRMGRPKGQRPACDGDIRKTSGSSWAGPSARPFFFDTTSPAALSFPAIAAPAGRRESPNAQSAGVRRRGRRKPRKSSAAVIRGAGGDPRS